MPPPFDYSEALKKFEPFFNAGYEIIFNAAYQAVKVIGPVSKIEVKSCHLPIIFSIFLEFITQKIQF